jgi:hypothetical protein
MFGHRKQGEPVNPTILANPVPDLHVVGMGILSEAGGFGLLRREEALLGLGDLEKSPLCLSVTSRHDTIRQLNK